MARSTLTLYNEARVLGNLDLYIKVSAGKLFPPCEQEDPLKIPKPLELADPHENPRKLINGVGN